MEQFYAFLVLFSFIKANVIISEVMYNPRQGDDFQFVEIKNTGSEEVDISSYYFSTGITFTFPEGVTISPENFLILASNPTELSTYYPGLINSTNLFGPWSSTLSSKDDYLVLRDASGEISDEIEYDDDWNKLTDGMGSSLERICHLFDGTSELNWISSTFPEHWDNHIEYSGTPLYSFYGNCSEPQNLPSVSKVIFTEIMYHPFGEDHMISKHEFLEIQNTESFEVSLSGWKIVSEGNLRFNFPEVTIGSNEILVIAKDTAEFANVYSTAAQVLGPYSGELSNGGEKLALVNGNGQVADFVDYNDNFPWPISPDELGGDEDWIKEDSIFIPTSDHIYKGASLNRISFYLNSDDVQNWEASYPNPGEESPFLSLDIPTIVTDLEVKNQDDNTWIYVGDTHTLFVTTGGSSVDTLVCEWVKQDPIAKSYTDPSFLDLKRTEEENEWTGSFPSQPENTFIRYRILISQDSEVISPRKWDPYIYHGFFVRPDIHTSTVSYHLFINGNDWASMYSGLSDGPTSESAKRQGGGGGGGGNREECFINENWNGRQQAVVAIEDKVIDCQVRYVGSRFQRTSGENVDENKWLVEGPSSGSFLALSYRIMSPKWNKIPKNGGVRRISLQKVYQGCSQHQAPLMYELVDDMLLPGTGDVRHAKLHINGQYFRFMPEFTRLGSDTIGDAIERSNDACRHKPSQTVGHLLKSSGCNCNDGPFGWGDERQLEENCDYNSTQRYEYTYKRKTWGNQANHSAWEALVNGVNSLNLDGGESDQQYLTENFDVNKILLEIAFMAWAGTWDETIHNHYWYQREPDHKWIRIPWDSDKHFGENFNYDASEELLYVGEEGNNANQNFMGTRVWGKFKNAFIKTFRTELVEKIRLISEVYLTPEFLLDFLEDASSTINETEWNEAKEIADYPVTLDSCYNGIKSWFEDRSNYYINTLSETSSITLSETKIDFCPDTDDAVVVYNSLTGVPGNMGTLLHSYTDVNNIHLSWSYPFVNGLKISSFELEGKLTSDSDFKSIYSGINCDFDYNNLEFDSSYSFSKGSSPRWSSQLVISTFAQNFTGTLPTELQSSEGQTSEPQSSETELQRSETKVQSSQSVTTAEGTKETQIMNSSPKIFVCFGLISILLLC